jgi:hypothetical protein
VHPNHAFRPLGFDDGFDDKITAGKI